MSSGSCEVHLVVHCFGNERRIVTARDGRAVAHEFADLVERDAVLCQVGPECVPVVAARPRETCGPSSAARVCGERIRPAAPGSSQGAPLFPPVAHLALCDYLAVVGPQPVQRNRILPAPRNGPQASYIAAGTTWADRCWWAQASTSCHGRPMQDDTEVDERAATAWTRSRRPTGWTRTPCYRSPKQKSTCPPPPSTHPGGRPLTNSPRPAPHTRPFRSVGRAAV